MKNITFFSIILSLTFLLTTPACEKSTDQGQVNVLGQNSQITPREDAACSDCPLGCCCCAIEMVGIIGFDLEMCGLCDGDYLCGPFSPNAPCSTVSGVGKTLMFSSPNQARHTFCVEPGASIRIRNLHPTQTAVFRFTCEPHLSPPPYVNVTLTPGSFEYFYNNGSCMVVGCP